MTGERAAELGLRFTYAGFPRERLELVGDLEAALDRGLELTPGGELAVLPTYTAMLRLRAIATGRGSRVRTGRGRPVVIIRIGHLYPEYLNIYADRGNIAVFERAPPHAVTSCASSPSPWTTRWTRPLTTSSTSAAARTASRR